MKKADDVSCEVIGDNSKCALNIGISISNDAATEPQKKYIMTKVNNAVLCCIKIKFNTNVNYF